MWRVLRTAQERDVLQQEVVWSQLCRVYGYTEQVFALVQRAEDQDVLRCNEYTGTRSLCTIDLRKDLETGEVRYVSEKQRQSN